MNGDVYRCRNCRQVFFVREAFSGHCEDPDIKPGACTRDDIVIVDRTEGLA
jgi:hypothetical protein